MNKNIRRPVVCTDTDTLIYIKYIAFSSSALQHCAWRFAIVEQEGAPLLTAPDTLKKSVYGSKLGAHPAERLVHGHRRRSLEPRPVNPPSFHPALPPSVLPPSVLPLVRLPLALRRLRRRLGRRLGRRRLGRCEENLGLCILCESTKMPVQ